MSMKTAGWSAALPRDGRTRGAAFAMTSPPLALRQKDLPQPRALRLVRQTDPLTLPVGRPASRETRTVLPPFDLLSCAG